MKTGPTRCYPREPAPFTNIAPVPGSLRGPLQHGLHQARATSAPLGGGVKRLSGDKPGAGTKGGQGSPVEGRTGRKAPSGSPPLERRVRCVKRSVRRLTRRERLQRVIERMRENLPAELLSHRIFLLW